MSGGQVKNSSASLFENIFGTSYLATGQVNFFTLLARGTSENFKIFYPWNGFVVSLFASHAVGFGFSSQLGHIKMVHIASLLSTQT